MNSNTCRQTRREIDELEIGRQLAERTGAHLAACPSCTQFKSERDDLRQLIGGLGPVTAPADFDMRLRARLARERDTAERQPFFARLIGMPAIAVAAMVVLAVATVVWIGQRNANQPTAGVSQNSPAQPAVQGATGAANQSLPTSATPSTGAGVKELIADGSKGFTSRKVRPSARPGKSTDYALASTASFKPGDSYVNAPSKPMVVSLEDDSGTKRKISLPAVSFGAQSLVDNRIPASYPGNSRVW